MLRRHRSIETNAGVPWNQLEVDSFLNGIDRAVTTPTETADGTTDNGVSESGGQGCSCGQGPGSAGVTGSSLDLRIPEIGVMIDLPTLLNGLHEHSLCETYDGTPIPVSQVRRMCCDANIIPYVLNGNEEVTDLGRSTRTTTRAQRRKLRGMHKTCVGDGCHVSASNGARSTTSSSGDSKDQPTSQIWCPSAPDTTTSPTKEDGH